ncbi:VOC family protein [uncultured Nocardioides sp.]|uniref:VOC family protein n=1 Tax=uncultured Nocardioides sp. TaxID=198441 RepID=UPI002636CAB2|nr:VOC family protein [uncultured Nocardioides sp.]
MRTALHHVELWTAHLETAEEGWHWLLTTLGWRTGDTWEQGRTWVHPDGTYIVLEQSPDVKQGAHDRLRAGLNHLAVNCPDADAGALDRMREEASAHGWRELFADRYPNAGGPSHRALFLENTQGFEVEIVAS